MTVCVCWLSASRVLAQHNISTDNKQLLLYDYPKYAIVIGPKRVT